MATGRGVSDGAMIGGILTGTLFGVLMGALFSVVGFGVVYEAVPLRDWFFKWQTLLSGVLAATAGVLVFYAAVYNERKAAQQKELEARVLLPFSLSVLNAHITSCLKLCDEIYGLPKNYVGPLENQMPVLDGSTFDDVRTLIRLSSRDISRVWSVVMADLQIVDSTIREIHRYKTRGWKIQPSYSISYIQGCIYNLAYLKVVINRFFPYSRELRDYDFSLVSYEAIIASLSLSEILVVEFKYRSLPDYIEKQVKIINDPKLGIVNSLSAHYPAPRPDH